ncbi:MAG: cation transporter [Proteobacteria bacterium]|nr:cation transporter [Pseudomonadota bacterium]
MLETYKKALWLEYFTVGYNVAEGVVSVLVGYLTGSVALVGFGLDSGIESLSGAVLIWRLTRHGKVSKEEEERVEALSVKLVGVSFLLLGGYVLYGAITKLWLGERPDPTLFGIAIAVASIIIMPLLARAKGRCAEEISSDALKADSRQTWLCSILSAALIVGLGLNYLYGLWWADPVSAIVISGFIFREAYSTLKSKKLCCC